MLDIVQLVCTFTRQQDHTRFGPLKDTLWSLLLQNNITSVRTRFKEEFSFVFKYWIACITWCTATCVSPNYNAPASSVLNRLSFKIEHSLFKFTIWPYASIPYETSVCECGKFWSITLWAIRQVSAERYFALRPEACHSRKLRNGLVFDTKTSAMRKRVKLFPSSFGPFRIHPASSTAQFFHQSLPKAANSSIFLIRPPSGPIHFTLLPMSTHHVIASSSGHPSQSPVSNGVVGGHYRVGKKIGEGSFGIVHEGVSVRFALCLSIFKPFFCSRPNQHLLTTINRFFFSIPLLTFSTGNKLTTSQPVAIKFVRVTLWRYFLLTSLYSGTSEIWRPSTAWRVPLL